LTAKLTEHFSPKVPQSRARTISLQAAVLTEALATGAQKKKKEKEKEKKNKNKKKYLIKKNVNLNTTELHLK
jgi:hypothetical protein